MVIATKLVLVVIVIVIMVLMMALCIEGSLCVPEVTGWASQHHVTFSYGSSRSPDTPHQPLKEGGRARRPPLTLALPCAGLGHGAQRAGGQTLPLVQEKPPLALDAEVLAEAALARGPAFCKRARATRGEGDCPEGGPLGLPEVGAL